MVGSLTFFFDPAPFLASLPSTTYLPVYLSFTPASLLPSSFLPCSVAFLPSWQARLKLWVCKLDKIQSKFWLRRRETMEEKGMVVLDKGRGRMGRRGNECSVGGCEISEKGEIETVLHTLLFSMVKWEFWKKQSLASRLGFASIYKDLAWLQKDTRTLFSFNRRRLCLASIYKDMVWLQDTKTNFGFNIQTHGLD